MSRLWLIAYPATDQKVINLRTDRYFSDVYEPFINVRAKANRHTRSKRTKRMKMLPGYVFLSPSSSDYQNGLIEQRMSPLYEAGQVKWLSDEEIADIQVKAEVFNPAEMQNPQTKGYRARHFVPGSRVRLLIDIPMIESQIKLISVEGDTAWISWSVDGLEKISKVSLDILAPIRQKARQPLTSGHRSRRGSSGF